MKPVDHCPLVNSSPLALYAQNVLTSCALWSTQEIEHTWNDSFFTYSSNILLALGSIAMSSCSCWISWLDRSASQMMLQPLIAVMYCLARGPEPSQYVYSEFPSPSGFAMKVSLMVVLMLLRGLMEMVGVAILHNNDHLS